MSALLASPFTSSPVPMSASPFISIGAWAELGANGQPSSCSTSDRVGSGTVADSLVIVEPYGCTMAATFAMVVVGTTVATEPNTGAETCVCGGSEFTTGLVTGASWTVVVPGAVTGVAVS